MPTLSESLRLRLKANRERSDTARAALVRRLAAMTPDQLSQVTTKEWSRLGSEGLAELVRQSRALAHLDLVPEKIAPIADEANPKTLAEWALSQILHWRAVEPLWWVIIVSTIKSATIAITLVLGAPGAIMVAQDIGLVRRPYYCESLNRWTSDCFYLVVSNTLTPNRAADLLHLSWTELSRANPEFFDPTQLIRRNSFIRVPSRRQFDFLKW